MNDARSAELSITSNLQELENMHTYLSETVRLMVLQGATYEMVSKYITNINDYAFGNEKFKKYSIKVYGFFDVFDEASYTLSDRPWYKAAVEANGKTAVTEPYIAMATGIYTLTFTRRIFNPEGKPLGIVCLDIVLDGVRELITNTHFAYNGYGILLNSKFEIIAHPDNTMLGKKMTDINSRAAILFFRQLKNGWYIAAIIPEETYFKEMRTSIIVLGIILAALFIFMAKKLAFANKK